MANYVYDADGNRYSAASAGTTTSYVVDTSLPYASVVEEYSNGTLAARYDYGDDLVRMDRGSGVYYYIYDGLGSTRQLVSTAGLVTDTWSYSAFGELASHTGSTVNPFLFNAQQFDGASGNYYLRARYYDQSAGRFISQDSYTGNDEDPATLHRYLYASCDPTDRVDPSGKYDGLIGISAAIFNASVFIASRATAIHLGASIIIGLTNPDLADDLAKAEQAIPVFGAEDALGATAGRAVRVSTEEIALELAQDERSVVTSILEASEPQLRSLSSDIRRSLSGAGAGFGRYARGLGSIALGSFSRDGEGLVALADERRTLNETVGLVINPVLARYGPGHAERRILEQVFKKYKGNSQVDGDLVLYSERVFCGNCMQSIQEFQRKMPNIRLHLIHSSNPVSGPIELVP